MPALATAGAVCAQEAATAITLGTLSVTDTPTTDESKTGYKISRSLSATKTDTPLVDVPQSVSVVSLKQIEDQGAGSIGDAIRYVPGVFSAQGEGNRETLVLRGNSTTGDFFADGVRDDVQTYRDLYNIERLEVFKGPNAMIFGRGGIGGVVNRVTKVANWQSTRELRLEGGSFGHKRGQLDIGAPVSERAAARLTGVYQDTDSYRDGVGYERWGINPTAAFNFGTATRLQIGYEHFRDKRVADRGVPARFRPTTATGAVEPLRTPRGRFFGDPANSPTFTDTDAATLFIEHQFSADLTLRNRTRYADYDKFYQNVFPNAVDATQTTVSLAAYNNATRRKNLINQTDLNAHIGTGSIGHTLLAGAEFGRQKTDNLRLEGFFAADAADAVGTAALSVPLASPNISRNILWRPIASSGDNNGVASVAAGYFQDQVEVSPQFQAILGIRYESFNTKVTDRRTVGFPAGQQRRFEVTDTLWSPRAGLIYKPVESASIYASFSRTYLPRGGDQLTGLSLTNQSFDPERFQNYEIGAKWDVRPGFNLTAALFQLDRSNVLALSDPNNASSPTVPIGRQRTRGIELSAAGAVTEQISVVGAYTYSDGRFRDNVSGAVRAGNVLANMPRHSGSLWARLNPWDKFGVGIGVIAQGRRYASSDNLVVMPGYARLDAALYYDFTEMVGAQLNIENLNNTRYFTFANSNNNITPASPTAVKVALALRL